MHLVDFHTFYTILEGSYIRNHGPGQDASANLEYKYVKKTTNIFTLLSSASSASSAKLSSRQPLLPSKHCLFFQALKMKFFTLASTLLLAGGAIAAPGTAIRAERHRRRVASHTGNPMIKSDGPAGIAATNDSHVQYSSNWAGAVLIGTGYKSVTATFKVPTPSTAGSGSAWVGIDGDTCSSAILQTGVDWTKSGSSVTYDAWYEWYPDYAYDFTGITISGGNTIKVTVTASSLTTGTAVIQNVSTGKSVTHTFNGGVDGDLCEYNAEWIVEDYEQGGSLVKFANFGTVDFTGCSAVDSAGTVGTTGATIIDIEQNGKILTDCSIPSSSEVLCKYV